jgi:hypothetical protein
MTMILEVNDVLEHVSDKATTPTGAAELVIWKKGEAKAMSLILDGIKDHVVPHLLRKVEAKDMWKALSDLYQNTNENKVMALCKQLRGTKMAKGEGVIPYLTKITQIRDELAAVCEKTEDPELVCIALDGFTKSWDVFVHGVVAREKLPDWQRLWDDFVQEEIRICQARPSSSTHTEEEEGLALTGKTKGKKKRKGGKKNINFSKVKFFQCHKMGHFASQCPERKKKKPQMAASIAIDEFAESFEEDFCFIACMSSTTVSDMWFVNNGASCHMIGHKEWFTRVHEGGVNLVIELWDDRRYKAQGVGTVSFQREYGKPLRFSDVLYVLGLTKNLISISTLEDKGYEVTFRKGKVFIRPDGSGEKMDRMIGVREEKVYKLHVQPGRALASFTTYIGELWHMSMVHIHFGALGHLREVVTGLPKIITERHDPCKGCALRKYAQKPFPSSEHGSKGVLDLIHSDVCGPMSVESVSGSRYFVLFIDDYSRKTCIYFLKTKDEVFGRFQEFRALVENHTGRKIWVLRSDNGGE